MAKLKLGSTVGGQEIAIGSDITTLYDRMGTAETNISNNDSDIATLDNRVDGNDSDISGNDSDIATLDGRVDDNDSDIATLDNRVDGNDSEINQIDGNHDGKVDNADRLNGKRWVTVASGSKSDPDLHITLKSAGYHHHYNFSAYCNSAEINYADEDTDGEAYITTNQNNNGYDTLYVSTEISSTIYYEVWSWE